MVHESVIADCQYDQEHDCLVGHFTGDMDIQSAELYLKEVVPMTRKHDSKRILNDMRNANIKMGIMDIYKLPSIVIRDTFDRSWPRAVIVKEKNVKLLHFYETVALNRGIQVKIFTDIEEGIRWLSSRRVNDHKK